MAHIAPTQRDLIVQIEADILSSPEDSKTLKKRLKAVQATRTDEAAREAYNSHVDESRLGGSSQTAPPSEPEPERQAPAEAPEVTPGPEPGLTVRQEPYRPPGMDRST